MEEAMTENPELFENLGETIGSLTREGFEKEFGKNLRITNWIEKPIKEKVDKDTGEMTYERQHGNAQNVGIGFNAYYDDRRDEGSAPSGGTSPNPQPAGGGGGPRNVGGATVFPGSTESEMRTQGPPPPKGSQGPKGRGPIEAPDIDVRGQP